MKLKSSVFLSVVVGIIGLIGQSCSSPNIYHFPKFGYKQFDNFVKGSTGGEIFVQEDHSSTDLQDSRTFFVFGMMNDSIQGRLPMGNLSISGTSINQVLDIWAAPLKDPIDGKVSQLKMYTAESLLLFEREVYLPKTMEARIPDTLHTGDEIKWVADSLNEHGIVVEIGSVSDTLFGFDVLEGDRQFFYQSKDEGSLKVNQSIMKALTSFGEERARIRIYRGSFLTIKTGVDFPGKVRFFYWTSCYNEVVPIFD